MKYIIFSSFVFTLITATGCRAASNTDSEVSESTVAIAESDVTSFTGSCSIDSNLGHKDLGDFDVKVGINESQKISFTAPVQNGNHVDQVQFVARITILQLQSDRTTLSARVGISSPDFTNLAVLPSGKSGARLNSIYGINGGTIQCLGTVM